MKIKKNTFSTLVLVLRFTTIANCKKLKIQKSTSPNIQGVPLNRALYLMGVANSESMIGGAPVTYRRPQRGGKGM
jgi:hypothetical protein